MSQSKKARIIGLGSYLPKNILSNEELTQLVDTSHDWIVSRTGMKERRRAHSTEFSSDMGFAAAQRALTAAGISSDQLELILVATMSPDYPSPSTATLIQSLLKASNAAAVDIQAACTGYLYALSMAKAFIESGTYRTILLVATEKMTSLVDYQDRNTCVLFGDGAAAAVISDQGSGLAIDTVCLGADGDLSDLLMVPGGGVRHPASQTTIEKRMHYMQMNGKELFKHAVRRMGAAATECMSKAGVTESQLSWLIPHQANERIIDATAKAMNLPLEKVYKTLHKYGNTSASGIGIALDELSQEQKIIPQERLLLVAFGGGLTWGASLLTKM